MADIQWIVQRGAAKILVAKLLDENGATEDLSGATEAQFSIRTQIGATGTTVLAPKAATIDAPTGTVECELSGVETQAVAAGVYVMDVAVRIGGQWYNTEPDYVQFVDRVTVPA